MKKTLKNVISTKKFLRCLTWGLNSGHVRLKAKALTTKLWRLLIRMAHNCSIYFTAYYYSLQRNWLMKSGMDNLEYWYPSQIDFFTSLSPFDACQLLMATFWHEFFSVCGGKWFASKWWGPWSPHNKHRTTNEGPLPDEVLVYIDFFCMHTLRIA